VRGDRVPERLTGYQKTFLLQIVFCRKTLKYTLKIGFSRSGHQEYTDATFVGDLSF
jgi:hypothetical protein